MSKKHSQYKKYHRVEVKLGSFVYRGELVTTYYTNNMKWYCHKGLGTPSMAGLLDHIDYKLSGASLAMDYLREQPVGSFFHCQNTWCVKTDFCGEHEAPGNWWVDIETGKTIHLGTLACYHVNYKPRIK